MIKRLFLILPLKDFIYKDKNNNSYPVGIKGLLISISGKNNKIEIGTNKIFKNVKIKTKAENTHIKINKIKRLSNTKIDVSNYKNQSLIIEDDVSVEGLDINLCEDNSKVIIGKDCMISTNVEIWSGDRHEILDIKTSKIINKNKHTLQIGNHCWLGKGVKVLKNANIADNTIVGAYSVVSKNFEAKNTILAGNPARIIKEDITWKR